MDDQGQGWLRGAIIAAAIAAASVYFISRSDTPQDSTADAVASTGRSALDALGSTEVGKRGGRIAGLLLGNVSDQAIEQVKAVLKDAIRQLDQLVDEL